MERYGDRDGDGYLEYERRTEHGLANQGWKDSGDSIFHADSRLAEPPIAPVEVQGYRYAALVAMAELAEALEMDGAADWLAAAATLRQRINDDFWIEREGTYALALDHHKRPCEVVASNAGHLLFCGVPYAGRARLLGEQIGHPSLEPLDECEHASGRPHRLTQGRSPRRIGVGSMWSRGLLP